MDIILGATGRVGAKLVETLLEKGRAVRAIVRNPDKAKSLRRKGAFIAVADFTNAQAIRTAFDGGDSVFVITAEDPASADGVAEATMFLEACRDAVQATGIRRVIGLSSGGAQHATGTGFLMVSYRLEHAFDGMDVEKAFIRPSYYYSNWMMSLPVVQEYGILPTFFPIDFAVPMIAPEDVARFAAQVFAGEVESRTIHNITGPQAYASIDIARLLGEVLGREVTASRTPEDAWIETLTSVGFSPANAKHMADMTAAVLSGLTVAEGPETVLPISFPEYAQRYLAGMTAKQ